MSHDTPWYNRRGSTPHRSPIWGATNSHIFCPWLVNHFWFMPSSQNLMIFKWCICDKGRICRILHLKHTEVMSVFFTITGLFQGEVTPNTPSTPKNQLKTFSGIPNASVSESFRFRTLQSWDPVQSSFLPCCTIHLLTRKVPQCPRGIWWCIASCTK